MSDGTLLSLLTTRHAYVVFVLLSSIGLYMVIANANLVKKLIGLNMFQTGIFLFFVTSAYVLDGSAPIISPDGAGGPYVSPLPHVIVLTAIVVGVSLTAVGLALTIRLYAEYGTLRADALKEVMYDE
ncbi:MAG: cation:proton antiporter subunit C [Halobacteriota archaeon]